MIEVIFSICLIWSILAAIGFLIEVWGSARITLSHASAVRKEKREQKRLDSRSPEEIAIDEVWK